MEVFLKFDISFFSVFLLLFLYIVIKLRKDNLGISSKLFNISIWVNIYMLILEVISWQFDGKPGAFNYYANYISNMLFAWSTTLLTCVWASYIDYHIFGSIDRLKRRYFYLYPMLINTVFIIINFFRPFIFSVSSDNVYSREGYMWLIVLQNAILLSYLWREAYKNRSKINKEIIFSILIFVIIPSTTAIAQVFLYGVFILWPSMAVTIVITYIFLETISTSRDYLTGLFSRHRLDSYIEHKINEKKAFGLIMIDLDNFKSINDNFGHISGDNALKLFSRALSVSASSDMVIGRYAGDEFLIISSALSGDQLESFTFRIKQSILELEEMSSNKYKIDFSIGYSQWTKENKPSYEDLINVADNNMYINKKNKEKISV